MILHQERLKGVHYKLHAFVTVAGNAVEWDILVTQGVRTDEQQAALYAKGRTEPGPKVTNAATAKDSAHGRGAAVDLCPVVNGAPDWNDTSKFELLAAIAKRLGLEWGGDMVDPHTGEQMHDDDHFQIPGWRGIPFP